MKTKSNFSFLFFKSFKLSNAGFMIVLILFSWAAFLKKLTAISLVFWFLSNAITDPSSGNANDIVSVLKPVKVPISKIFFILEVLTNKCKKWHWEIEICILFISPKLSLYEIISFWIGFSFIEWLLIYSSISLLTLRFEPILFKFLF